MIKYWLLIMAVLIIMVMVANHAFGSDRKCWLPEGCKSNAMGSVQYTTNPFIYEVVNHIASIDNVDGNLNLRINPMGTYMLYDENIFLCGIPEEKLQGITEPFVMTYERVAHHSVHGVGCHVLLRVDSLKPKEGLR